MERRLLIAFLLSTALIMAYNFFYYGPKLKRQQAAQRTQQGQLDREQARADSLAAQGMASGRETAKTPATSPPVTEPAETPAMNTPAMKTAEPGAFPLASPEAATVTVTTPLFEMKLSTDGARITSVRLFEYKTHKEPVELVRQDMDTAFLGVRLVGEDRALRLSGVQFDAFSQSAPLTAGATVRLDPGAQARTVSFRATTADGRQIERYYTFLPDSYQIRTGVRYAAASFPYADDVEWSFGAGLQATEPNVRDDQSTMRATVRLGDEVHSKKTGDFSEAYEGVVQWAVLKTKYFIAIVMPEEPTGGAATLAGVKDEHYLTGDITLPAVAQRGSIDQWVDVYMGPQDYKVLKTMGRGLEHNISIGFDHVKIFQPVSRAILWSMVALHKFIPNYGLIIILISVLTKVLFYRLTHKSFKSMRDMQSLQPRLAALKEKYKGDRQKLSEETMKLYKESGVNPLGGCLPMLLQMPVFLALFNVLRNTIEIRRAPFFGWINDLSQQDVLATLPFSLPIIGNALSVLPLLMGVSMLMQSKIGGGIAGPEGSSTQPKAMTYMMPIVFTVLFYKMPSGLVLYWLVNTVLSVAQQYYINKGAEKAENSSGGPAPDSTPTPKPQGKQVGRQSNKPKRNKKRS